MVEMANWAIVIGIDKYWKPQACLRGAVRDALKIYDWLTNINGGGVPTNNLTLLLEPSETSPQPPAGKQILSPTQDGVFAAIQHLLSRSYKQGGRFYFYYSGHGIAAWMNQSNQDGITFSDFSEANPLKSVTLDSIYDLFKATQFKEQFFFIDACRNIPWEREFRISDYPFPEKPIPPVLPQYIIYATSPGVKAIEINKAGDEHGAFTEVLLDGLRGKGKSKVWDDNAQEYVVHWDNLVKYVGDEVEKKRLKVDDGLIQEPREYGDHKGSPEFGRFPEGSFPKETLDVNLDPLDIPPKTEVVVGDLGGVVQSKSPVNELPVRFSLDPGKYSVRAAALSYRSERKYYPVDLYTPETVLVKLIPGD
ncbi:caspase family protein, partial [Candidatus Poribacteria bacterium]|nr:caspase family protein [Candidatus Poribacteria bacterium]